jgi:hypothetical protein
MRRLYILILLFLALTACNRATPVNPATETPGTENPTTGNPANNPQPQPSEHKITFDKTVTWAAYQKDGKWEVVNLNKDTDTVVTLTGNQGAFVYLCDQLADEFNSYMRQSIFYFESDALQRELKENSLEQLPAFYCTYTGEIPTPPTPPTAKVHGAIAGLSETDGYQVLFKNDTHSLRAFPGFPRDAAYDYETLGGAYAGTYDALATIFPQDALAPTHGFIEKNAVTVASEDVTYDFDFSKAVKLDTYTFSWKGLNVVDSIWTSIDMNGLAMFSNIEPHQDTTINYAAFPSTYVADSNYSVYSQATADGCYYSFSAWFKNPLPVQTNPLPCAKPNFELNTGKVQPEFKLSWTFPEPFQSGMLGISFEQGRSLSDFFEGSGYTAGVTFIGDFKDKTSYTLEDFSTLPGWKTEWSLKNEATIYNMYYANRDTLPTGMMQNSVSLQGIHRP